MRGLILVTFAGKLFEDRIISEIIGELFEILQLKYFFEALFFLTFLYAIFFLSLSGALRFRYFGMTSVFWIKLTCQDNITDKSIFNDRVFI